MLPPLGFVGLPSPLTCIINEAIRGSRLEFLTESLTQTEQGTENREKLF